jgi:hypothetical protein
MLQVTRKFPRPDWQQFYEDLLGHCLAWPAEKAGIADSPMCHGAAGVAHVFNRIYQTTGDERCRAVSLFWYERMLNMRKEGTGVGGFTAIYQPDPGSPSILDANPAFLDGSIGISLTLLSAVTKIEPSWDRSLLLSGGLIPKS